MTRVARIAPWFGVLRWWSVLIVLPAMLTAATSDLPASELETRLRPLIEAHAGKVAAMVRHLDTGESFAWRADEPMPTASLIKFPVMIEAYRQADQGKLDLETRLTLREEDKVPGSGILSKHFSEGAEFTVRDAVRMMIAWSDNTATNLVLDQIGLPAVNATMSQLDCPNTKIHAKVFRTDTSLFPERSQQFGLGSTTAREMISLFERLHREDLASSAACKAMLEHLSQCEDRTKLAKHLPSNVPFAHKSGAVSAVRCDAGILQTPRGPVAICVLTSENRDRRWLDDNAANLFCAAFGHAVYEHFAAPKVAAAPTPAQDAGVLQLGSSGRLVEDLQRTLNVRLSPAPGLVVDGTFGAATQAAVVQFQESKKLTADGVVRRETWEALGPLVTSSAAPDPQVVNRASLTRRPPDPLDGPPLVTCQAWAIGNGRTGELLWGHSADAKRAMASTTKIMTAWLVIQLAEKDASVLDEEVTFSDRADRTAGTTASLRAGERLPVRELLYGLLLPSGNDASVALAEHFGPRFSTSEEQGTSTSDPVVSFVAEMNATAERLGLQETHYVNPHGLSEKGHESSARDLMKLGWTAMQNPLFREYVQTRQRGCCVVGVGGYRRNVLWKNTNALLGIEGYLGVKTGTTSAAGACLVSQCRRGDDELLVVVLGSTSPDARYTDTRNLYRWAWRQRGAE